MSTDTQLESFLKTIPTMPKKQEDIYRQLESHPDGLTCRELENLLNQLHQTVSGQLTFMQAEGLIADSGKRKWYDDTRRHQVVWIIKKRSDLA